MPEPQHHRQPNTHEPTPVPTEMHPECIEVENDMINPSLHALLSNPIVHSLPLKRQNADEWTEMTTGDQRDSLHHDLESIYLAFEPAALRLITRRIRQFNSLDRNQIEDIYGEQRYRLWFFVNKFRWEDFAENCDLTHCKAAFITYLNMATGSFFAKDVINEHTNTYSGSRRLLKPTPITRPVEDYIIAKERNPALHAALANWKETTPAHEVKVVLLRSQGQTTAEIATSLGLPTPTVKGRIARGKQSLARILKERGIDITDITLHQDTCYTHNNREQLLETRRNLLIKRYESWYDLVPPLALRALEAFYGLNGHPYPLYNYREVAEATGIPLQSVRVSVPRAFRIIAGIEPPSDEAIQRRDEQRLFEYWRAHRDLIALPHEQELVLRLYFEDGLPYHQIGKRQNVCKETARRRTKYALNLIKLVLKDIDIGR